VAVDFQTTWPVGHKESGWCKIAGDDEKASGPPPLAPDDPAFLRYFSNLDPSNLDPSGDR
jgi:hypothetical protein